MFTGIIQTTGRIQHSERRGGDLRLVVGLPGATTPGLDISGIAVGDSVAVSGCCLTVVAIEPAALAFDVSNETLGLTTLGELVAGNCVNLELAMRLSDRLGGHLVAGHVDGVGCIVGIEADARSQRWRIEVPPPLLRYIAAKGSVCVDGVSLTVNAVSATGFEVNLIPHTVAATRFRDGRVGERVNIEVDLLARHVARLLEPLEH